MLDPLLHLFYVGQICLLLCLKEKIRAFYKHIRLFLFSSFIHLVEVLLLSNFLPGTDLTFVLLFSLCLQSFNLQILVHWSAEDLSEVTESSLVKLVFLLSLANYIVPVPVSRLARLFVARLAIHKLNHPLLINFCMPNWLRTCFELLSTELLTDISHF